MTNLLCFNEKNKVSQDRKAVLKKTLLGSNFIFTPAYPYFHCRFLIHVRLYDSSSLELNAYLAYVSEGMGELQDWKMVMKYQRKNGSLFNSPSTTAASLIRLNDSGCLDYLRCALTKLGNAGKIFADLFIFES